MEIKNWADFYKAVKDMRESQIAYNRTHSKFAQEMSRMWERQIDDAIASREKRLGTDINPQMDLFR